VTKTSCSWKEFNDKNIPGSSTDLKGCSIGGDIRKNNSKMKKCKEECENNPDCEGVVFHKWGTMLKKSTNGMNL
jgi:hypothetical protein